MPFCNELVLTREENEQVCDMSKINRAVFTAVISLFDKMTHKCKEGVPCTDCNNGIGVPDYLKNLSLKELMKKEIMT